MKIRLKHECCIDSLTYPAGSVHDVDERTGRSMIPKWAEEVPEVEPPPPCPVVEPPEVAEAHDTAEPVETAALDTSEETATKPQPLFRRRGRHHKTDGD